MKVAYQGEKGAFSEQAIIQQYGQVDAIPMEEFEDVFEAVEKGKADYGMMPVENFIAGSINKTYDLLLKHKLFIVGEVFLPIHFYLIVHPGVKLKEVKRVYSHPMALAQCSDYIREHKLKSFVSYDTAGSVKEVKESKSKDSAAIASKIAAEIHEMEIIAKNIEDIKNNVTRFVVVAKKEVEVEGEAKSSIVFSTKNVPKALYNCLGAFANNDLNLTKIESRPVPGKHGEYVFYLDFEGNKTDSKVIAALKELDKFADYVKFLGSYPKGNN